HHGSGTFAEPAAPHLVAHDALACERLQSTRSRSNQVGTNRNVNANPETTKSHVRVRAPALIAAIAGAAAASLALVYGIGSLKRNAGDPQCAPAVATAQRVAPFARGEVAALAVAEAPLRLPDVAFHDAKGAERHLSEWRGRTVLLNLWATWCIPC